MNSQLDFEEKVKKLMKSRINWEAAATMDFLPEGKKCTWLNAMCLSLANKAVKGDINAIKYINEICKNSTGNGDEPFTVTVKVIED